MRRDLIYIFINYVGYLGGVIWIPVLGYLIGQGIESVIFLSKKPVVGGFLGAVVGLLIWIIFILPRVNL